MLAPTPMTLARICNPSVWKCYTRIANPSERGCAGKSERAGLFVRRTTCD